MPAPTDLTGRTVKKLTVLGLSHKDQRGKKYYQVQCSCGSEPFPVRADRLASEEVGECEACRRNLLNPGEVFGALTVLAYSHTQKGHAFYLCQCSCGSAPKLVDGGNLKTNNSTTCGACTILREGQMFGKFTVVRREGSDPRGHPTYLVACSCGNTVVRPGYTLRRGTSKDCGCGRRAILREVRRRTAERYRIARGFTKDTILTSKNKQERNNIRQVVYSVLKRDNFTCQLCGAHGTGIRLVVHHVDKVEDDPSVLADPSRMITLCSSPKVGKRIARCHEDAHQGNFKGPVCPELQRYFLLVLSDKYKD